MTGLSDSVSRKQLWRASLAIQLYIQSMKHWHLTVSSGFITKTLPSHNPSCGASHFRNCWGRWKLFKPLVDEVLPFCIILPTSPGSISWLACHVRWTSASFFLLQIPFHTLPRSQTSRDPAVPSFVISITSSLEPSLVSCHVLWILPWPTPRAPQRTRWPTWTCAAVGSPGGACLQSTWNRSSPGAPAELLETPLGRLAVKPWKKGACCGFLWLLIIVAEVFGNAQKDKEITTLLCCKFTNFNLFGAVKGPKKGLSPPADQQRWLFFYPWKDGD